MSGPVPPDFGGLIGYWLGGKAYLVRYGQGQPIEGIQLTPLNALQARKLIDDLIEQGTTDGHITAEHQRQSAQLLTSSDMEIIPRSRVDEIAGDQ